MKPNPGKKIEIDVDGVSYARYPITTEVFKKGDDYAKKISKHVSNAVLHLFDHRHSEQSEESRNKTQAKLDPSVNSFPQDDSNHKWYVIVSEKIVAISQGRSYFIKDIKPSWWANTLSKYVRKTPYGIGLGSPWTMQLAIQEVGLPRILVAAVISVLTKPFGFRGVFYHIAGREAAAIDGPTSYSLYPSNVSAKLAPKDPQSAAESIKTTVCNQLSAFSNTKKKITTYKPQLTINFGGAVIIDANDLGRDVLGNATDKPDSFFGKVMRDNPMGQGHEGTPLIILL